MGWIKQAQWLSQNNLVQALPGLRPAAAFWGHPPGLHFTAAALWKLFGLSLPLPHFLIACFAALGVCGTFLLARHLYDESTALFSALLLLLSPIYLAQAGMFLGDLPVAALGVTSVYFALRDNYLPYLLCASYMVLIKEHAIALVVALVLYLWLATRPRSRATLTRALKYSVPLFVIGLFFVLQKITTGHFFYIYDFEFEPLLDLGPERIRNNFTHVTEWIFVQQGRWIFTVLIALDVVINAEARKRRELRLFLLIILFSGYSFSFLYLLPRYLLPTLPFFYILGARAVMDLTKPVLLRSAAAVLVLGLMLWSLASQRFRGNAEFNLKYLDAIALQKEMAEYIASDFPNARILTAWPHGSQLRNPLHGYVTRPLRIVGWRADEDLSDGDLILVSSLEPASDMNDLKERVNGGGWRLIKRLEKEWMEMELYARAAGS